ncbi:MAG TPA: D-arabinono-1,4-lactone oxidase, partial [Actinomycetaceae bacterium]|nr:D-arabinono-1,4-lactone oxidase [Actinomycetaceae bacterium]
QKLDHDIVNWSGSLTVAPDRRVEPRSEEEVSEVVRFATRHGQRVRPIGSAHSSTPIIASDDIVVSLDRLTGVVGHDAERRVATVLPGTGLADLGSQLADVGLALENFGDVDYQTIAGAVGTGTHGTGETLGNLSSMVLGGRLVTGDGDVLLFGHDAGAEAERDLTRAAQVSLGTLGIMTSLTLRVRPSYDLHRYNVITHIEWVLDHFDDLAARYRHVDFYWYPRSDLAQLRILDEPGRLDGLEVPGRLHREEVGPSYEILPNTQELRFEEMEYMLPRALGLEAFRRARERINERHRARVAWRVLVRTVAADDAMLSPSHRRPTMTIALLHNASLPYEHYFGDMEPLFLDHGGRPHWGKKHSRTAPDLAQLYPDWEDFAATRRRLDPHGVFRNDYLDTLLEAGANDGG